MEALRPNIPCELQPSIISGVRRSGNVLFEGEFGEIAEVTYAGTVCIGKFLYEDLCSDPKLFLRSCIISSRLRHPNVVQFLGVYFVSGNMLSTCPVFVTEKMECDLFKLMNKVPDIPLTMKVTILQDVAKGVLYLHRFCDPPIMHRFVCLNTVLLTSGMKAKINHSTEFRAEQCNYTSLTQCPGDLYYQPPEALDTKPNYDCSIDMFSFGHLMLSLALQEISNYMLDATYIDIETGLLKGRSEIERREKYLLKLTSQLHITHPLVLLVKQCLDNQPKRRPTAKQALESLEAMHVPNYNSSLDRLNLQKTVFELKEGNSENKSNFQKILKKELNPFTRNVQATGVILGHGAYGHVVEVRMGEKILAAKSFREMNLTCVENFVRTFCSKTILLLKLNHPNIIKYEGLCFLSSEQNIPSLLMERMTCNLHQYLTQTENLMCPLRMKVSILQNVASGLSYLHSQVPAIIHRDLSANNVLLDDQLNAKIGDFGNARIVDLDPLATPMTMTANPGTLSYMPPEVYVQSSECADKLDSFSFGHLSLFVVVQEPVLLIAATYMDGDRVCGRSEVERRGPFVEKAEALLGKTHPVVVMMKKCLHLSVSMRPSARVLLSTLQRVASSLPDNTLTMDDLHEVSGYLLDLSKDHIFFLGLSMGLLSRSLQESRDCSSQSSYLLAMLQAWLRRQDRVEQKLGPPSWSSLVAGLRDISVRQTGIANRIEREKLS